MNLLNSKIWYADEERANSPRKLIFHSDSGSLFHEGDTLKFAGNTTELDIDNISNAYLARPTLNWVSYLLGACIFAICDLVFGYGVSSIFDTAWVLTKLYLMLAPLCILLFWLPMKWLVIEYKTNDGQRKAYFSLGGLNGFNALFGGNRKLLHRIENAGLIAHVAG